MTQSQVAASAASTRALVGSWERGRAAPTVEDAAALAAALGVPTEELTGRAEPFTTRPRGGVSPDAAELITVGRRARGWSRAEFAERIHTAPTTVGLWERGAAHPSRTAVRAAGRVFGWDPSTGLDPDDGRRRDALVDLRERSGLTQSQLSGLTGIDQRSISRVETGELPPSVPTIRALAEAYGVDVAAVAAAARVPDPSPDPMQSIEDPGLVGTTLRAHRLWRGWSLSDLARRAGVPRSRAIAVESASGNRVPDGVREYASALGFDPDTVVRAYGVVPVPPPGEWRPGTPVGERLRAQRAWIGRSLRQVAEAVGVSYELVRMWERPPGDVFPSGSDGGREFLAAVADAYGWGHDEFIDAVGRVS